MQAMEATTPATKVIYGVNELDLDLAGKSIRGIWKVLEQVGLSDRVDRGCASAPRAVVWQRHVVRPGG